MLSIFLNLTKKILKKMFTKGADFVLIKEA